MALNPGSRPRGPRNRTYARSIHLDSVELGLLRHYAKREGLAIGAAIRELALGGLLADAERNPDAAHPIVAQASAIEKAERAELDPWLASVEARID